MAPIHVDSNGGETAREVDIADFCRKLAASGITQPDALKAVADLWPSNEASQKRLLRLSEGDLLVVEDEVALKDASSFFNALFSGPFKEGQELLVDLSKMPPACRSTTCMKRFVHLAESRGAWDIRAELGTEHVKELVPLMNLCNYFSAEHLEEVCMSHIMNHWRELLRSPCQAVVREIPWSHFERLLASVQSAMDVVTLASLWCMPAGTEDDPLAGVLKRRCGDLAQFSLDDMLAICSSHPHILAKLPSDGTTSFFRELRRDMRQVHAQIGQVIQSALPELDYRHKGHYRAGYSPGWSCCGATLKKSEGCFTSVQKKAPPSESSLALGLGMMKDVLFDKTSGSINDSTPPGLDGVLQAHSDMLDYAIKSEMEAQEYLRESHGEEIEVLKKKVQSLL